MRALILNYQSMIEAASSTVIDIKKNAIIYGGYGCIDKITLYKLEYEFISKECNKYELTYSINLDKLLKLAKIEDLDIQKLDDLLKSHPEIVEFFELWNMIYSIMLY